MNIAELSSAIIVNIVTYFALKKIDMIDRVISFIDDTKIALDDVIDIEDVSFDDL